MTDAVRLQRTAHHEAAHAVADLVFGHRPQLVSIRPTDRYNGVCQSDIGPRPDGFRAERSVPQQPADLRARVEADVISMLAGPIAGDAFWPETGYYAAHPDAVAAEQMIARLEPRYRELLSDLETEPDHLPSDHEKATEITHAFAGPSQATAYYAWLRSVAHELVTEYARQIHAVAEALLERTVLTGEELAVIVRGNSR